MLNPDAWFEIPCSHKGFEDIMVYGKYPEGSFNPKDYFNNEGYFKINNGPILKVPPIKKLIEINKREEERQRALMERRNKQKSMIKFGETMGEIELHQCPICRHLVEVRSFEKHYKKCLKKEKEEMQNEKNNDKGNTCKDGKS